MKKVLIFYALLIGVIIIFALFLGGNFLKFTGGASSTTTAKVEGKTYKLILAKSDQEKIKGLSGRDKLNSDEGMLFIFPQKDYYSFWMKNMKFPIDIIFINDDTVVDFVENAPPPSAGEIASGLPVYKPSETANYVLEVNAHEVTKNKIKKGDKVEFKNVK